MPARLDAILRFASRSQWRPRPSALAASVLRETLSANLAADAKRTADGVAKQLQQYFVQQDWIAPQ